MFCHMFDAFNLRMSSGTRKTTAIETQSLSHCLFGACGPVPPKPGYTHYEHVVAIPVSRIYELRGGAGCGVPGYTHDEQVVAICVPSRVQVVRGAAGCGVPGYTHDEHVVAICVPSRVQLVRGGAVCGAPGILSTSTWVLYVYPAGYN